MTDIRINDSNFCESTFYEAYTKFKS